MSGKPHRQSAYIASRSLDQRKQLCRNYYDELREKFVEAGAQGKVYSVNLLADELKSYARQFSDNVMTHFDTNFAIRFVVDTILGLGGTAAEHRGLDALAKGLGIGGLLKTFRDPSSDDFSKGLALADFLAQGASPELDLALVGLGLLDSVAQLAVDQWVANHPDFANGQPMVQYTRGTKIG